jgi:hypothetical protein
MEDYQRPQAGLAQLRSQKTSPPMEDYQRPQAGFTQLRSQKTSPPMEDYQRPQAGFTQLRSPSTNVQKQFSTDVQKQLFKSPQQISSLLGQLPESLQSKISRWRTTSPGTQLSKLPGSHTFMPGQLFKRPQDSSALKELFPFNLRFPFVICSVSILVDTTVLVVYQHH